METWMVSTFFFELLRWGDTYIKSKKQKENDRRLMYKIAFLELEYDGLPQWGLVAWLVFYCLPTTYKKFCVFQHQILSCFCDFPICASFIFQPRINCYYSHVFAISVNFAYLILCWGWLIIELLCVYKLQSQVPGFVQVDTENEHNCEIFVICMAHKRCFNSSGEM